VNLVLSLVIVLMMADVLCCESCPLVVMIAGMNLRLTSCDVSDV